MKSRENLQPDEVLLRVFRRGKTDLVQEWRIGDFARNPNNGENGISLWRLKLKAPVDIYEEFFSQRMGLFKSTQKLLKTINIKLDCFSDNPAHVDLCCPGCNGQKDPGHPCQPIECGRCPLFQEPGHILDDIGDLFSLFQEAEPRTTKKQKK